MVGTKKRKKKFIVGAIVVLILVVGAMVFSFRHHQDPTCERVVFSIVDKYHLGVIDEQHLCAFLKRKGLFPQEKVYSNINCYTIETALRDAEVMIRSVECYKTTNNEVVINILVREPLMEVFSEHTKYLVDNERQIIPYRVIDNMDIIHIRGKVDDDFATGTLFDFVRWINTDTYWQHKVHTIKVLSGQQVEFYLKVLPAKILLGDLTNFMSPMKKLQTLLAERDTTEELRNYNEIDLRFHSQVICRK